MAQGLQSSKGETYRRESLACIHFIALVCDEGDAVGREVSDPTGTRIYGHFFRRDDDQ
jgi:hypothetical protein